MEVRTDIVDCALRHAIAAFKLGVRPPYAGYVSIEDAEEMLGRSMSKIEMACYPELFRASLWAFLDAAAEKLGDLR
jgi:hypothetical protein